MRDARWCNRVGRGLGAAVFGLLAASCGPDIGECNDPGPAMPTAPYEGQLLVHNNCANGRCHSADAMGAEREGAPAELNFDLIPASDSNEDRSKAREGSEQVNDHRESIWAEIEGGNMPPAPPAGTGELNATDKEAIRNWLACGAKVFAGTGNGTTPIPAEWNAIYEELVSTRSTTGCMGCHGDATAAVSGGGFRLGNPGDACAAYDRVVGAAAVTTTGTPVPCAPGSRMLVVAGNPDASLLLRKVEGTQDCGSPMPLGDTDGLGASHPVVQALRMWISMNAPRPSGC